MFRKLAFFVSGASALTIIAWAMPSGATSPVLDETPPSPATNGASVYNDNCSKCHGSDGKGDTGMGKKARDAGQKWPDLTKSTMDAAKTQQVIENGVEKTKMKAFSTKLSADQISIVRDYVMAMRKP